MKPLTKCNVITLAACAPATVRVAAEREAHRRFRSLRIGLGWTQIETAEYLTTAKSTVERWEAKVTTMPAWPLVALELVAAERKVAA